MSAYYALRPFDLPIEAFNALYPDRKVKIDFIPNDQCADSEGGKAQGFTLFPDDGSVPEIWINGTIPIEGLPDTVAHELAHVVCGFDADHGPEWDAVYQAIWVEMDHLATPATTA
jgi:hypothetical protein